MLFFLIELVLLLAHVHSAFAAPIDDLIAAAKKEGVIELLAPVDHGG